MDCKKYLESIEIDKRSGYSVLDVIRTLMILNEKPMGRTLLMKKLDLNEASVKTLIKKFRSHGITKFSTKGQVLTERGKKIASCLSKKLSKFVNVQIPSIGFESGVALVVKKTGDKVKFGIEQRDEGMKLGVRVITLVYSEGKLKFPGTEEDASFKSVEKQFDLEDGDVLIIASGSDKINSEKGCLAAALTLI
jgi:predicted transcriptional regulator